MLNQLQLLSSETDGRFASDSELQFLDTYTQSFNLRLSAYTQLKAAAPNIVEQVHAKISSEHPELLQNNNQDISKKWKSDTLRTLRQSAIAVLTDDPARLKERFLYWFQTLMQAFEAQRSCDVTYTLMTEAISKKLPQAEAKLVCQILELTRSILGSEAQRAA